MRHVEKVVESRKKEGIIARIVMGDLRLLPITQKEFWKTNDSGHLYLVPYILQKLSLTKDDVPHLLSLFFLYLLRRSL